MKHSNQPPSSYRLLYFSPLPPCFSDSPIFHFPLFTLSLSPPLRRHRPGHRARSDRNRGGRSEVDGEAGFRALAERLFKQTGQLQEPGFGGGGLDQNENIRERHHEVVIVAS